MILVIKNTEIEGPGIWKDLMEKEKVEYKVSEAYREEVPTDLSPYSHILLLGGPMSANDEDKCPYLTRELELIKKCIQEDKPILGVCLGSQLIAKALGAGVYPTSGKEIGWGQVELTRPATMDYLFSFMSRKINVFQWHDETFDLPRLGVRLAASDPCPNQAFRFKNHIYGIQFHLEVTQGMINRWKEVYKDEIQQEGAAIPSFIPSPDFHRISWEFFSRFLQLPRSSQ